MNNSNMKNMVVLKNLPSNLVEEAIIILKANQKIKNYKYILKDSVEEKLKKDHNYIIKEAEFVVSDYISKLENKKKENDSRLVKKYKKLKIVTCVLMAVCWVELIAILV